MSKKTLLIIAAVAVMLIGATSAYGYQERWNGWVNSGFLTYDGYTFDYEYGEGMLEDHTSGDVDSFAIYAIPVLTFTCSETGDTFKLWPGASGSKDTGQEGQKEVDEAEWSGNAIRIIPQPPPDPPEIEEFAVWGTWQSTDPDCFDYTMCPCPPNTPTYSAAWVADLSRPAGITGRGGSEGERIYYEE